jgi:hypothetical protein
MAGMLTDDPLFEPVMNSSNPAALVSMLADLGYPVATAGRPLDGGGESDQVCLEEEAVHRMATLAELAQATPVSTPEEQATLVDSLASQMTPCGPQACTPYASNWIVSMLKKCTWELRSSTGPVRHTGGWTHTCVYEERMYFRFVRARSTRLPNCLTINEKQCNTIVFTGVTHNCVKEVLDGDPPYTCPFNPTSDCIDLNSDHAICSTPTPPTPTVWYTPPCP